MFELKYRIFEKNENLKDIKNLYSIYGFIHLKFNDNVVGYVIDDDIDPNLEENDKYLYNEDLIWWFETLVRLVCLLHANNFIRIGLLETFDRHISFKRENDKLIVKYFEYIGNDSNKIMLDNVESKNVFFCEKVTFIELEQEILSKTTDFLEELQTINLDIIKMDQFSQILNDLKDLGIHKFDGLNL